MVRFTLGLMPLAVFVVLAAASPARAQEPAVSGEEQQVDDLLSRALAGRNRPRSLKKFRILLQNVPGTLLGKKLQSRLFRPP